MTLVGSIERPRRLLGEAMYSKRLMHTGITCYLFCFSAVGFGLAHDDDKTHSHPLTLGNVSTGVNQVDTFTGTVYVVSVSGPKMYNLSPSPVMQRVAEDTQLYQVIRIEGDRLFYESRTAIGELYDGFALEKQPGSPNQMTEFGAVIPERRRPAKEPSVEATEPTLGK